MTEFLVNLVSVCYPLTAYVYLVCMCYVFWNLGQNLSEMEDPRTDFLRQITTDWTTVPFIDIEVTDDWYCDSTT